MKAWLYQDAKQVKKLGKAKASWYVGWLDPAGKRRCKSFGPGAEGKRRAFQGQKKIEAQLLTGTYQDVSKKKWAEFRTEYDAKVLTGMAAKTRAAAECSLGHFERIVKPQKMTAVTAAAIASFVATRRQEPGLKDGSTVSPATVNHDLRHIKSALSIAHEWGFLPAVPKVRMEKEPKKLPTYVTPDHFARIYAACDQAKLPANLQGVSPGDWWRALLVMGYMTGWRISELLALRRDDLDLEGGVAVTRAEDNKGRRDERVQLHPVVIEHLRKVRTFGPCALQWDYNPRTLHAAFLRLQEAAGIHLPCAENHGHTRYCHVYGFHDLRRAFATMNADRLTADSLQALMRHKSYQTTQRYIALARQMDEAVASLHSAGRVAIGGLADGEAKGLRQEPGDGQKSHFHSQRARKNLTQTEGEPSEQDTNNVVVRDAAEHGPNSILPV
jgi:integrase